ncbi:cutA1 divalent ion tolerance protein domain-containing protein [Ditylenchus destructor]|uniref:CutA1 divalent ion tolerance protein domain-containing protein n=1 Tax=Ditylenchus destructor TaxID=166010 RepID=A0AAD4MP94_9BILA|nr:cutA1 divalent ion tolerance protein domain-containing protein [Ditylenchus destructor]
MFMRILCCDENSKQAVSQSLGHSYTVGGNSNRVFGSKALERRKAKELLWRRLCLEKEPLSIMSLARQISSIFSVVYVTVPSVEVGKQIARRAVEGKLAACVNIIPQLTSIYEWDGRVREDTESMLIIKTKTDQLDRLKEMVLREHPYDVPEFITLPIEHGSEPFLKWVSKQVGSHDSTQEVPKCDTSKDGNTCPK